MDEQDAMLRTLGIWNSDQAYRDHVRTIWPELGRALDALNNLSEHTFRSGNAPAVQPLPPTVPRKPPPRHSAARWDTRSDGPTSATGKPVQTALDLGLEEEK